MRRLEYPLKLGPFETKKLVCHSDSVKEMIQLMHESTSITQLCHNLPDEENKFVFPYFPIRNQFSLTHSLNQFSRTQNWLNLQNPVTSSGLFCLRFERFSSKKTMWLGKISTGCGSSQVASGLLLKNWVVSVVVWYQPSEHLADIISMHAGDPGSKTFVPHANKIAG